MKALGYAPSFPAFFFLVSGNPDLTLTPTFFFKLFFCCQFVNIVVLAILGVFSNNVRSPPSIIICMDCACKNMFSGQTQ